MENQKQESIPSKPVKIIHVQIVDGSEADVYEIGKELQRWNENSDLPYKIHAIITDDKVGLKDVDSLIQNLWKLKKELDKEKGDKK